MSGGGFCSDLDDLISAIDEPEDGAPKDRAERIHAAALRLESDAMSIQDMVESFVEASCFFARVVGEIDAYGPMETKDVTP